MPWKQAKIIALGLPRPDPLALCTLGAQEVTKNGMYRLPHVIYYCSYIARVRLSASETASTNSLTSTCKDRRQVDLCAAKKTRGRFVSALAGSYIVIKWNISESFSCFWIASYVRVLPRVRSYPHLPYVTTALKGIETGWNLAIACALTARYAARTSRLIASRAAFEARNFDACAVERRTDV